MKACEPGQHRQLRRKNGHITAACDKRGSFAGDMLLFHQKGLRDAACVQRPADNQGAFGNKKALCRIRPVYKLILCEPRINIQLRRGKILDFNDIYHNCHFSSRGAAPPEEKQMLTLLPSSSEL